MATIYDNTPLGKFLSSRPAKKSHSLLSKAPVFEPLSLKDENISATSNTSHLVKEQERCFLCSFSASTLSSVSGLFGKSDYDKSVENACGLNMGSFVSAAVQICIPYSTFLIISLLMPPFFSSVVIFLCVLSICMSMYLHYSASQNWKLCEVSLTFFNCSYFRNGYNLLIFWLLSECYFTHVSRTWWIRKKCKSRSEKVI